MKTKLSYSNVLLVQGAGFLALMALSWVNETLNLRALILGDHPYISDFREAALEMLFVLAVWLIVCGCTRRLLARNNELESFIRICSWCRRVGAERRWMSMEEFFGKELHAATSHGICEECLARQEEALEAMQRQPMLPSLENLPAAKPQTPSA